MPTHRRTRREPRSIHGVIRFPKGARTSHQAIVAQVIATLHDSLERRGYAVSAILEPRDPSLHVGARWIARAHTTAGKWDIACRVWWPSRASYRAILVEPAEKPESLAEPTP